MSASLATPPAPHISAHAEPYHPSLGILDDVPPATAAWVTTLLVGEEPMAMAVVHGPRAAVPTAMAAVVVVREALGQGDQLLRERPYLPGFSAETVLRSRTGTVETPAGAVVVRVCTATTFAEFDDERADTQRWSAWLASPWAATTEDPLATALGDAAASHG